MQSLCRHEGVFWRGSSPDTKIGWEPGYQRHVFSSYRQFESKPLLPPPLSPSSAWEATLEVPGATPGNPLATFTNADLPRGVEVFGKISAEGIATLILYNGLSYDFLPPLMKLGVRVFS